MLWTSYDKFMVKVAGLGVKSGCRPIRIPNLKIRVNEYFWVFGWLNYNKHGIR